MALNVEWRYQWGSDAIVVLDSVDYRVKEAIVPDARMLRDYLAVTGHMDMWRRWQGWQPVEGERLHPDDWGELVIGRAEDGAMLSVDPELFWEGVSRWFRSRGEDYTS